jgi:hypothetical protein
MINKGTIESRTGTIIEHSAPEKKPCLCSSNGIVTITARKKELPDINEALYLPGMITIFLSSKNLNVINEK